MRARLTLNAFGALLLPAILITQPATAQHVYNAVADFTLIANPGAHWSYLTNGNPLPNPTNSFAGIHNYDAWDSNQPIPNSESVARNATGATVSVETIVQPTDLLLMDPESSPSVVVRFTVPIAGLYTVKGQFQGIDTNEQTHSVEILHNGAALLTKPLAAYGAKVPFKASGRLAVGDTIDFVSTTGNSYSYLSTGLEAELTGP